MRLVKWIAVVVSCLALVLPLAGPGWAQQEPTARDGRRLSGETPETQAMFNAVWGSQAAQEWVTEHNAAIGAAPAPAAAPPPAPAAPAAAPAPAPAAAGVSPGAPPTLTITAPQKGQNITTFGGQQFTITGTASDPNAGPTAIDKVDVWINGERGSPGGTDLGIVKPQANGSWSIILNPTRFPSTHTNLYAYAHSTNTDKETLVNVDFNIIDRCIESSSITCPK
jgi:Bacterial Ig domain